MGCIRPGTRCSSAASTGCYGNKSGAIADYWSKAPGMADDQRSKSRRSGKIQEIADLVRYHDCDAVIFDLELSPWQHRMLESALETQVLDRTALILLICLASANSFAEDKLFATLDSLTRRVRLAGGQEFLLTDTVGFVQRLPTTLVAAFWATLEEVAEADLLVHVVDTSYPVQDRQIEEVEPVPERLATAIDLHQHPFLGIALAPSPMLLSCQDPIQDSHPFLFLSVQCQCLLHG